MTHEVINKLLLFFIIIIIKCKMLKCQRKINWEQSALHLPKGVSEVWGSRLSHSFQRTLLLPVSPLAYCPKYPQTTKAMAENTQMVICTTFQYDSTSIIYIYSHAAWTLIPCENIISPQNPARGWTPFVFVTHYQQKGGGLGKCRFSCLKAPSKQHK